MIANFKDDIQQIIMFEKMKLCMSKIDALMMKMIPGYVFLFLAVTVFSAGGAVYQKISNLGAFYEKKNNLAYNPIQFCNVLTIGNSAAAFVYAAIYRKDLSLKKLRKLTLKNWAALLSSTVFYTVLGSPLQFLALTNTSVISVVLISQLSPFFALVGYQVVLGLEVKRTSYATNLLAVVGVVLAFLFPLFNGKPISINAGDYFAFGYMVSSTISKVLSKTLADSVPLGLLLTFR